MVPALVARPDRALSTVSRFGGPGDRKAAGRIRGQNTTALVAMNEVMVDSRAGDPGSPMLLDQQVLEPVLREMTTELDRAAAHNRAQAMASLHRSQSGQRIVLVGALITFALGLLLAFSLVACSGSAAVWSAPGVRSSNASNVPRSSTA